MRRVPNHHRYDGVRDEPARSLLQAAAQRAELPGFRHDLRCTWEERMIPGRLYGSAHAGTLIGVPASVPSPRMEPWRKPA